MKKLMAMGLSVFMTLSSIFSVNAKAVEFEDVGEYGRPGIIWESVEPELTFSDEMLLVANLVQAEAGNQGLLGKRLVVDVVLNRLDDSRFPNSIEEIIYEPGQFSVASNGRMESTAAYIDDETYEAVRLEFEHRTNVAVLYFNCGDYIPNTQHLFKEGGHYFSTN